MLLADAAQMREADRRTIEEIGVPGAVLMENAAQGAAQVLLDAVEDWDGLEAAAFCGRGNNGGDGLAIARILANRGVSSVAYLFCRGRDMQGDAALNLKIARACGVRVVEVPDDAAFDNLLPEMAGCHVYIDALLGTGLNSPVRGLYARAIDLLNGLDRPVLAVDIPSGLSADTGAILGRAARADWTASFGLLKLGLALEESGLAGELHCVDISIPPQVISDLAIDNILVEEYAAAAFLPPRPLDGHKGTFGRLLVAGGSAGKSGAPCLAAMGGLRAGAGLVTVCLPQDLNLAAEVKLTAAMSQPLPQTSEGSLSLKALPALEGLLQGRCALVLGPGLSTHEESAELVRELVARVETPLVVDADGLNALAGRLESVRFASDQAALTPHPGEAARLLDCTVAEILADRPRAARRLARLSGAVVVLKGARTVTASPEGDLWVNPTGNPLLASGGSGDVLAGVIGGLMAQGLDALEAACAGAFVHGLAADLARVEFGLRGMAAEELVDFLPAAFSALEGELEDEDLDEEPAP